MEPQGLKSAKEVSSQLFDQLEVGFLKTATLVEYLNHTDDITATGMANGGAEYVSYLKAGGLFDLFLGT